MIRWRRALLVAGKELRDTLRDRRTLLMMVLVPALLYPLGGVAITHLTVSTMAKLERQGYDVAVPGPVERLPGVIRAALRRDAALRPRPVADAAAELRRGPDAPAVALLLKVRPAAPGFDQVAAEVLYDSKSARSRAGLDRLRKALDDEAAAERAARLRSLSLTEAQLTPLAVEERSIADKSATVLSFLAPVIGILLILLSLVGAFYPAIDLIAGERERGTLEALLCTPTGRLELLGGKYLCLIVLALLSCVLNLCSMGLTTSFMLNQMAKGDLNLTPQVLLLVFAGTVPVLLLVTALLLMAAVFARSFKDAQNLMTPVYLACLLPAFGALLPEMHLGGETALVPVLNTVLFIKEALTGSLRLVPAFLALGTGLLYSALAIALAAHVFERPELVGARPMDQGLSELVVRVGRKGEPALTLTGALGLYGLCLVLMFHVAPRLQLASLRPGLALSELGLLLVPVLLLLALLRVPLRSGLGLRPLDGRQLAGTGLAGVGAFALTLFLSLVIVQRVLHPPEEYVRALQGLLPRGTADTLLMLLLAAALPALCEEALCRGLILQAALRTLGGPLAVLLAGFLFAILHLDPYRFPTTLFLGCLLGAAALRSGSIVPAMGMHFLNNALTLLLAARAPERWQHPTWPLGLGLLAAAGLGLLPGFLLLKRRP